MKNFISLRLPSLFFLLAGVWMLIQSSTGTKHYGYPFSYKDTYLHGGATTTNYGGVLLLRLVVIIIDVLSYSLI